ncbi:regulator of G-protein signaling [Acrasis kona]|uniref:Regulator of G-protein signaling n=1 Tax=Acrasis kona TaxID=1008807 RepID=A0AAW2YZM0_9EUKA
MAGTTLTRRESVIETKAKSLTRTLSFFSYKGSFNKSNIESSLPLKDVSNSHSPGQSKNITELSSNESFSKKGLVRMLSFRKKQKPPSPTLRDIINRKRVASRFKNMDNVDMLKGLLSEDPMFHDLLLKFARSEFCSESVLFYDQIISYKKSPPEERKLKFRMMYNEFLMSGSIFEINIDSETRQLVETYIWSDDPNLSSDSVVEVLELSAVTSLKEVFDRFEMSETYKLLKNKTPVQ